MDTDALNRIIGNKIKNLRNQKSLTQEELADRTELTKGYISQLERGLVAPSVITLFDLIECLGTTPTEFFKDDVKDQVVYNEATFFEKIDDAGNSIQWIVPSAQKNQMEPLLVVLQGHEALSEDKPHEGEEFGYVLKGSICLHLGDKSYTVKTGESFYFKADCLHFIENRTKVPAKFLWVSTPPSF